VRRPGHRRAVDAADHVAVGVVAVNLAASISNGMRLGGQATVTAAACLLCRVVVAANTSFARDVADVIVREPNRRIGIALYRRQAVQRVVPRRLADALVVVSPTAEVADRIPAVAQVLRRGCRAGLNRVQPAVGLIEAEGGGLPIPILLLGHMTARVL